MLLSKRMLDGIGSGPAIDAWSPLLLHNLAQALPSDEFLIFSRVPYSIMVFDLLSFCGAILYLLWGLRGLLEDLTNFISIPACCASWCYALCGWRQGAEQSGKSLVAALGVLRFSAKGLGFRVQTFGFRVLCLGLRV